MGLKPVLPLVLIVDDDLTTTRVLELLLQRAGFETVCAHTLADAGSLAGSRPVSLVLLDLHLPDGDSLDLCRKLSMCSGIPILFISANDDVSAKVKGFAAGGVDYITKPLAGAEVIARVRTHLRLRAAYESLSELQAERIQRLSVSQQSLMPLPEQLPEAGFEVRMAQALKAGGDFYDVIPSGGRITDYVVADASGHDLGASLWTASFKTLLTEYATILHTPRDICGMINRSLRRVLPQGHYFTAIYARLNRASNELTLINAGHPCAVLFSRKTGAAGVLPQTGDVIGIFPDAGFGELEVTVRPGDRLFLYSDGLIEMRGSREEGIGRLTDACQSTIDLPLKDAVTAITDVLADGGDPADDIVLMGVDV